jgi:hypothetical protein
VDIEPRYRFTKIKFWEAEIARTQEKIDLLEAEIKKHKSYILRLETNIISLNEEEMKARHKYG